MQPERSLRKATASPSLEVFKTWLDKSTTHSIFTGVVKSFYYNVSNNEMAWSKLELCFKDLPSIAYSLSQGCLC